MCYVLCARCHVICNIRIVCFSLVLATVCNVLCMMCYVTCDVQNEKCVYFVGFRSFLVCSMHYVVGAK